MRQLIFTIFIILHSWVGLRAQTREYLFSYIGEKDGLNEQNINSIQQDRKGFIWIATHNALQRYDGQRFLTFRSRKNQPGAIPQPGIRSLITDHKNRLWMLTGNTRLGYFDVDRFVFHEVPIRYPKDFLEKSGAGLYLSATGDLMLILVGRAVFTYSEAANEMAEKYNKVKLPSNWRVNHMWQHPASGVYWLGCDSGLAKFNPATQLLSYRGNNAEKDPYIQQFEHVQTVLSVYLDKARRMWLTYWPANGLSINSYHPSQHSPTDWRNNIDRVLKGSYFEMHGVTELSDGSIWMAGQNLLARVNERSRQLDIVKNNTPGEYSIRYDRVSQLMEDKEKNVWIVTDKGLFRFNPSAQIFRALSNRLPGSDSLYDADVTDILQTNSGEILVSAWGSGIFAYDKYFNPILSKYINRKFPAGEAMIWCMIERRNGDIWRGSQDGYLFIYQASTGQTQKLQPAEFGKSTIRQMAEDKNGHIWFGTQRGTLIKWEDKPGRFLVMQHFKSIISRVYIDDDGELWVCTANAGLHHLNTQGRLIRSYTADGGNQSLLSSGCADIIQYNDSLYCIASDGLSVLNSRTGKIIQMTVDDGLPSTNITNLVKDKQGLIWMTCASGIASYNPLNGKLSAYNSADGVHTNAFGLASGALLKDGRIVFGTTHDMLIFDPVKAGGGVTEIPKVEITGISIHNKFISTDSVSKLTELKLDYQQNSLSFQLSTLTYQNILTVYYKMENLDKDWKAADKLKTAVYNYLPPGNYTFRVACKIADGSFGIMNSIPIRINAPFWKSWWFYGSLLLAALFVIYWLDKQRITRIRREQDIRASIAGNLHQEVNSTLQNINVLSEIAGMKAEKDPGQSKDYIHEIKQKSRNMVIALNDVLWSIDPANDSMDKNIDRMREMAESLKNKYNTAIEFRVEKNVRQLNLDMKQRHEFISIYKLSIVALVEELNAVHTIIQLDYHKGFLQLKIHSRVSNFYKTKNSVVKSIHAMQEKARAVGATLDIQSDEKNTGIVLSIKA